MLIQTKEEFRFIIPYVEFSNRLRGPRSLVLDTSVIIDGRIADICDTGILDTKVYVPRFVLQELQSIADSSDKIKRNRGRRGLDILKRMQTNPKVDLQMHEASLPELREGNESRRAPGRVGQGDRRPRGDQRLQPEQDCPASGVDVINLNELSNALKLVALPAKTCRCASSSRAIRLAQGVGYLDDGTMVVVEAGPRRHRPGGQHHRDERPADARRTHDLRAH